MIKINHIKNREKAINKRNNSRYINRHKDVLSYIRERTGEKNEYKRNIP